MKRDPNIKWHERALPSVVAAIALYVIGVLLILVTLIICPPRAASISRWICRQLSAERSRLARSYGIEAD